jgi:hypothetical protein
MTDMDPANIGAFITRRIDDVLKVSRVILAWLDGRAVTG